MKMISVIPTVLRLGAAGVVGLSGLTGLAGCAPFPSSSASGTHADQDAQTVSGAMSQAPIYTSSLAGSSAANSTG